MQITDTILMVRPAAFSFNEETAANNYFQQRPSLSENIHSRALQQFDKMVELLRDHQINILVFEDTGEPVKPDAIFPNNWLLAANEKISVFPMYAPSRRYEKRDDILQKLFQSFEVKDLHDWGEFEAEAMYLEGTGSMVMDHENRIIYSCLSPRTTQSLLIKFATANGYRVMSFHAHDHAGREIYHTNVMMCIGEGFAVLCPKAITDHMERIAVSQLLETSGHENIYISPEQMQAFAGNMLHVKNRVGEKLIILSATAMSVLKEDQINRLQKFGKLLPIDVSVIENVEGGSVRCMMAEIFLKPKN